MEMASATLGRRKNSFGKDLEPCVESGSPVPNMTSTHSTFRTLPRPVPTCKTPSQMVPTSKPASAFTPVGGQASRTETPVVFHGCTPPPIPMNGGILCTDARCHFSTLNQKVVEDAPFNSSCQQCVAERAAAEAGQTGGDGGQTTAFNAGGEPGSAVTAFSPHPAFSSPLHNQATDRSKLRVEFSREDDVIEPPMATSILPNNSLMTSAHDDIEPRGGRISSPAPGRTYECESLCRHGAMVFFSTVGITVITMAYIAVGGALFSTIEHRYEMDFAAKASQETSKYPLVMNSTMLLGDLSEELKNYIDEIRGRTVSKLWDMTEKMNILYPKNWTEDATQEILKFQDLLCRKLAGEILARPKPFAQTSSLGPNVQSNHQVWDFTRGVYYSVTLITTIGSGCEGVKSPLAKLLSAIYVVIGIPLGIIYLHRMGAVTANLVRCACCSFTKRREDREDDSSSEMGSRGHGSSSRHLGGSARRSVRDEKIILTPITPDDCLSWQQEQQQQQQNVGAGIQNCLSSQESLDEEAGVSVGGSFSSSVGGWPDGGKQSAAPNPTPSGGSITPPLLICSFLMIGYVSCSSLLMAQLQGLNMLDSFYLCLMTILTVGGSGFISTPAGRYPPMVAGATSAGANSAAGGVDPGDGSGGGSNLASAAGSHSSANLLAPLLYIVIGLILVATCCHIIYEEVYLRVGFGARQQRAGCRGRRRRQAPLGRRRRGGQAADGKQRLMNASKESVVDS